MHERGERCVLIEDMHKKRVYKLKECNTKTFKEYIVLIKNVPHLKLKLKLI